MKRHTIDVEVFSDLPPNEVRKLVEDHLRYTHTGPFDDLSDVRLAAVTHIGTWEEAANA